MTPEEFLEELNACDFDEDVLNIIRAMATQYYEEGFNAGYAKAQTEIPVA